MRGDTFVSTHAGFAASALALVACGGSEAPVGGPNAAAAEFDPPKPERSAASECPGPRTSDPSDPVFVDRVEAMVFDLDDQPATGTRVSVCGTDLCVFGKVGVGGLTTILPDAAITKPAFACGHGLEFAAVALPVVEATAALGTVYAARLPPPSEGAPIVAGEGSSSNGVILSLEGGAIFDIDPISFRTDEEKRFRAVFVPLTQATSYVDPDLGLELLVATTPVDARFCPPAQLQVPNKSGWEAGTEVEFFLHGVSIIEDWAPYGGWAMVSTGRVTEDGTGIVTDDGLPMLSVVGVRRIVQ